jgi:hypothetical protein
MIALRLQDVLVKDVAKRTPANEGVPMLPLGLISHHGGVFE